MKKAMIEYMQKEINDNIYTPPYAVKPLLKYIPPHIKTIWECCDAGNSQITKILKQHNYNVISTDIRTGFNFLTDKPDFDFDMIITNPPYSLKDEFLKKCYEYNKPFALLLPLTALEGINRNKLFRKYGISVIVYDRRINFTNWTSKNGCWFNTSWFIWKVGENNHLYFEELKFEKGDEK